MKYMLTIYIFVLALAEAFATAPQVTMPAQDQTLACGSANLMSELAAWYNTAGGAQATDPDGGTIVFVGDLDLATAIEQFENSADQMCGNTMAVTVSFTAVDSDNETADAGTATFRAADNAGPLVTTIPSTSTFQCQPGIQDTLIQWIKAKGGAIAQDACSAVTWTDYIWNDTQGNSGIGSIDNGPYPQIVGACQYKYNMSFIAVDECGNQRGATGSFTIVDNTAPVFTSAIDTITVSCDNIPAQEDLNVIDFCDPEIDIDVEEISTQSGSSAECSFYNYTLTRIYTATDACGNAARDTFVIHVADLGPPIINGQDTITVSCQSFGSGDSIFLVAIDDCSEVNIAVSDPIYTPSCRSELDRVYTITDICGNEVTFDQHVIIEDIQAPQFIISPRDTAYSCAIAGVEQLFQDWLNFNLSLPIVDGCTEAKIFAAVPGSYDIGDSTTWPGEQVGTFDLQDCPSVVSGFTRSERVDYVLYDDCGNAAITQAIFGLSDTVQPIIDNCPVDMTIILDSASCETNVNISALVVTENCDSELSGELVLSNGESYDIDVLSDFQIEGLSQGSFTANIIVEDCAGNQANCSFAIEVLDQESPVFVSCITDDQVLIEDENCSVDYLLSDDVRLSDNCSFSKVYQQKQPASGTDALLVYSVLGQDTFLNNKDFTFSGVDSIQFAVEGVEIRAEVIVGETDLPAYTIFGENGFVIGTTEMATPCVQSILKFNVPVSEFNAWVADGQVELSIVANATTISTCQALQADGTDGLSTMFLQVRYSDAELSYQIAGATTVGRQDLVHGQTVELNTGSNIVTYFTTDASGNEAMCTYNVNVRDASAPEAICKNAIIRIHPDGEQVAILDPTLVDDGSGDQCSDVILTVSPSEFTCDQVGSEVEVTLTATDLSGNKDSCTATVKVEPFELIPTFSTGICQDDTLRLFANAPTPTTPGSYTYVWSGPNFSSSEANPFILDADDGNNGVYTVVVRGFNGCEASGSVQISIAPLTTPIISAAMDSICAGDDIVLTATAFTGNITYDWYEGSFPDGTLVSSTTSPSLIFDPAAGVHFYYVVASSASCTSNPSSVIMISSIATPTAMVDDNFINICEGETITLGTSSFGQGYKYSWTGPDGFTSDKPKPENITNATLAKAGKYNLIIAVGNCQSDTAVTRVNVFEKPIRPIITSGQTFCEGSTVSLTVNNAPSAELYTWYLDGSLYTTETDNSLVINNAQANISGSWQVVVKQGICDSDSSLIKNIVVEDLQDVSVTNSGPACEGDSIQLFVTFIAGAVYEWSGPSNFTSQKQNPKILARAGDYTVNIITGTNCETTASTTVSVNSAPVITALSNNSEACMDGETNIVFFPTIVPATNSFTYRWSGPNGFISDQKNPSLINPTEADNGIYSLVVINDDCESAAMETIVDISIIPEQPAIIVPAISCLGQEVVLTASPTGVGFEYTWMTPNTTVVTTEPTLVIASATNADAGEYTVIVDNNGCLSTTSLSAELTLTQAPAAPVFTSNQPVCYGEDIVLTVVGAIPGATYLWEGPAGNIPPGAQSTIVGATSSNEGLYSVSISTQGCESAQSTEQFVAVRDSLITPKASEAIYDLCLGVSTGLEICLDELTAEPGATYILTSQNLGFAIDSSTSICFLVTDLTAFAIGTNFMDIVAKKEGCISSVSPSFIVELSDVPTLTARILESDRSICEEESFTLTAQDGPPLVDVLWSSTGTAVFATTDTKSTSVSNLTIGENDIILSYSQDGCVDYDRDTVVLTVQLGPVAEDDEYESVFSEPITLDVLDNDDIPADFELTILDEPFVGAASVENDQIVYIPDNRISGLVTFTYRVCNVDCPDQCSEATVSIQVGSDEACIAPTIITPNADAINDRFVVPCLSGGAYSSSRLTVFNQWGDEVYSAQNYENDWDGTYEGKDLQAGTYFYILDIGDGREPIHSFLIIQR